jgi:DNA-binding NtrC family response regulator
MDMLDADNFRSSNQTVVLLHLASQPDASAPYTEALVQQGLQLVECQSAEDIERAAHGSGCVGLMIATDESALSRLDQYEALISDNRISWVGLISKELITEPRMRQFICTHLFNFITLPADANHIVLTLRHAWGMASMRGMQHAGSLQEVDAGSLLVGKSPEMQHLTAQIAKVARTNTAVLISGASGSGKAAAAQAIHRQSSRREAPFVTINCSTATSQQIAEEAPQGGTLFFDEIGELPPDVQASLLLFLQENGGERDVRIISGTRSDLAEAVRDGRFREELYYRINVVSIDIPVLADRGQDIEDIARHYFTQYASVHNKSLRGFSKAAMNAMLSHSWPGNVRELVNRVQRATVMAEGRFIQPEDLGFERESGLKQIMSLEDARAAAESMMIRRALSQSRNQISRAASLLGVSRVTLYRLIEKYNIRPELMSSSRTPFIAGGKPELDVRKQVQ